MLLYLGQRISFSLVISCHAPYLVDSIGDITQKRMYFFKKKKFAIIFRCSSKKSKIEYLSSCHSDVATSSTINSIKTDIFL